MSLPQFLIVTPSYNQAEFIEQTIQSVLNQEDVQVHYQVMDGGSTDGTGDILKKYGKQLNFVSKKDNGQADAINMGIRTLVDALPDLDPNSTFACYLNSDDFYLPGALAKVADRFRENPTAAWVVGDCLIVNEHGQTIQSFVRHYKRFWRWVYFPLILKLLNPIPQPAVFMRLSAMMQVGEFDTDLRYTMDYDYWLRLQKQFGSPQFLDVPLAAFRIHGGSKGGSQYRPQFAEELHTLKQYCKNPLVIWLHRLHTMAITTSYSLLKG